MQFFKDLTPSAVTAGFVSVLVGITSSVAIVFQAALAFKATPDIIASWMWALGLGMGFCTVLPSLWLKKPVMVAWSTPGAAVLATAGLAGGFGLNEAVGAFMVSAALIVFCGVTGLFERVMNRLPMAIASALLAGVLARFGMQGFTAAQTAWPLVALMLLTYLLARRWVALYAIPLTLTVAIAYVFVTHGFAGSVPSFEFAVPIYVAPMFSWGATISLALPLFVVTMASQNLPGVAAIQAAGYRVGASGESGASGTLGSKFEPAQSLNHAPQKARHSDPLNISKIIVLTGLVTLVLAPFGAFALGLSAITAAICMGRDAHPDPEKRYTAAVTSGAIYLLVGVFGAAITGWLTAFPRELIAAIAGLALLGTIGTALVTAVKTEDHREAAIITFLVTLSGLQIAGIGSAFWGVAAGTVALFVQQFGKSRE